MLMPMIIGEIRRYLRDNNTVRVSRSMRDLAYKALAARESLARQKCREATIEEITEYLNANGIASKKEDIVEAMEAIIEPVSLFDPVWGDGSDDTMYVMDQIGDTVNTDEAWLEDIALREALGKLNDRERMIINLRFFKGRTQMEIADEIGISQAQVSRLEKGALERMKKQII